jgi:DNA polymerase-3 subunit delta'
MTALPPWLTGHWQHLWRAYLSGRLGHAWLLTGMSGLGKRLLAERLTQALLCSKPADDGAPCGGCGECRLFAAGNHPDVQYVTPETESTTGEIKVEAIRRVIDLENLTPYRGRRKVIHLYPADAMTRAAANSLLKTLEEPTESTLLLLIAEEASRLPATIRSRCQRLMFVPPAEPEVLPWLTGQLEHPPASPELLLRLAEGAPLRALELAQPEFLSRREQGLKQFLAVAWGQQDPLAVAAAWQSADARLLLELCLSWLCDLARLSGDPEVVFLSNPDQRETLQGLAQRLPGAALHEFLRQALRMRTLTQSSVNKQLLFESLMIRWAILASGSGHRSH